MSVLKASMAWESLLLFAICTADMLSTLHWVHLHQATEANPWMALWLHYGDAAFVGAKMLSYVPFLMVAAYYRPRRPRLIAISLRGTIALYMAVYVGSIAVQFLPF